jgi:hypothetical protein
LLLGLCFGFEFEFLNVKYARTGTKLRKSATQLPQNLEAQYKKGK